MDEGFTRLHGPIELVTSEIECWECKKQTLVHALQVGDVEEFEPGEESDRLEAATFIYDIGSDILPAELVSRLAERAPNYKPMYSHTMGETTWANACTHCGRLQGAFFLHNEPDGPFFGGPEEFQGERKPLSAVDFDVDGVSYWR